jgi:hypothetical protein
MYIIESDLITTSDPDHPTPGIYSRVSTPSPSTPSLFASGRLCLLRSDLRLSVMWRRVTHFKINGTSSPSSLCLFRRDLSFGVMWLTGLQLNGASSTSRLGFLRCAIFDVSEILFRL